MTATAKPAPSDPALRDSIAEPVGTNQTAAAAALTARVTATEATGTAHTAELADHEARIVVLETP